MCGISGFYAPKQPIDARRYYDAHYTLRHRGPDDEGFSYLKENQIHIAKGNDTISAFQHLPHIKSIEKTSLILGQRRLSIIDLSEAGHQPYQFEHLSMIFNGEIFNYKEIRADLVKEGYEFVSQSDTEVLIKAFHRWGMEIFNRLNGMWALAIYNNKTKQLILSRDRFGIKPMYYTVQNGVCAFGSEMKFLLSFFEKQFELNQSIVDTYLKKSILNHSTHTFWKEIYELETGHSMVINEDGSTRRVKYWDFEPNVKARSEKDVLEEFTYLFEDSIRLRMQSDVEVGSLLSGGLDSTTIVCTLQKLGFIDSENFKSFSGVYSNKKYSEDGYIKDTIQKTGLNGTFVNTVPEQLREDLELMNYRIEEPFISMSIYTQLLLYRQINQSSNVKVVLNGQGADELFGGYNNQYRAVMAEYVSKFKWKKFNSELDFLKKHRPPTYKRIFKVSFLRLVLEAFMSKEYFNQDCFKNVTYSPLREYLKYDDRTSMTYGVEARAPFMDYRLVEFALSLETKYKIDQSINKKIVRDYAHDLIPTSVRDRKDKMGFTTPQENWQRNELKADFDEIIDEVISNPSIKAGNIKTVYHNYQASGKGNFLYFWRVYNLHHWGKTWKIW